jgi:hypothetical protein
MKYNPRLNGKTKCSEFISLEFSDGFSRHCNHITGVDTPWTDKQALTAQHAEGDLFTKRGYLTAANEVVHPPEIE